MPKYTNFSVTPPDTGNDLLDALAECGRVHMETVLEKMAQRSHVGMVTLSAVQHTLSAPSQSPWTVYVLLPGGLIVPMDTESFTDNSISVQLMDVPGGYEIKNLPDDVFAALVAGVFMHLDHGHREDLCTAFGSHTHDHPQHGRVTVELVVALGVESLNPAARANAKAQKIKDIHASLAGLDADFVITTSERTAKTQTVSTSTQEQAVRGRAALRCWDHQLDVLAHWAQSIPASDEVWDLAIAMARAMGEYAAVAVVQEMCNTIGPWTDADSTLLFTGTSFQEAQDRVKAASRPTYLKKIAEAIVSPPPTPPRDRIMRL